MSKIVYNMYVYICIYIQYMSRTHVEPTTYSTIQKIYRTNFENFPQSWADFIIDFLDLESFKGGNVGKVLRLGRALRPLRLMKRNESMRAGMYMCIYLCIYIYTCMDIYAS